MAKKSDTYPYHWEFKLVKEIDSRYKYIADFIPVDNSDMYDLYTHDDNFKEFIKTNIDMFDMFYMLHIDHINMIYRFSDEMLNKIKLANHKVKIPRRWDKKWRILIFDIKETRRGLRNKVRSTLISIGFIGLQKSVWVYPYDCEDLINLIKSDFKVGKDILYMIVDRVENDKKIREHFGLSS